MPCAVGNVVLIFQIPILGERTLHHLLCWAEDDDMDVPDAILGGISRAGLPSYGGAPEPELGGAAELCHAFVQGKTKRPYFAEVGPGAPVLGRNEEMHTRHDQISAMLCFPRSLRFRKSTRAHSPTASLE